MEIYAVAVLIIIVLLLLTGIIYQRISLDRETRHDPPPGRLVDVGGYKLHLNCVGQGSPTVIMDYGLGGLSPLWGLIEPQVAQWTQVCTYDRAGYGWSDPSQFPRTSEQMVEELHRLLTQAEINPPYILVGHSLGGLNMRLFASLYPEQVAGLVLVDAVPANVYSRLSPVFAKNMGQIRSLFGRLVWVSRLGLLRLSVQWLGSAAMPDFVRKLPPLLQNRVISQFVPRTFQTAIAESQLLEQSAETVNQIQFPRDLPLVVLSQGINMFSDSTDKKAGLIWQELQAEMAQLSTQGCLRIAKTSGHNIHIDQPELVVEAIKEVLTKSDIQFRCVTLR
ncbi:alpha/beta fold hydrolase [Gloeothece verrucosa]|nr:alpha/beta hydrolase [Gloeothece verrucosa]